MAARGFQTISFTTENGDYFFFFSVVAFFFVASFLAAM